MIISIFESHTFARYYPLYSGRIFHSEKDEHHNIQYEMDIPEDDLIVVEAETGLITIFENGMKNKAILKQFIRNVNYNIL